MSTVLFGVGDKILCKKIERTIDEVRNGIIIPAKAADKESVEMEIVAMGTGKRAYNGVLIPFEAKVGDRILVGRHMGVEVNYMNQTLYSLREDDIHAFIRKTDEVSR